jgi:tetratricopeptide (TPR) repeat protein
LNGEKGRCSLADTCSRANGAGIFLTIAFAAFVLPGLSTAQTAPSDLDDIVAQATSARQQGDIPAAIKLYAQAVSLKPEWAEGWWALGMLQYQTADYAAAQKSLDRDLALHADSGPALAVRGLCEYETADYVESLRDIQRGLALGAADGSKNEGILRYHEALLLTRSAEFEGALRDYKLLSQYGQSDPEMLIGFGLAGLRRAMLPNEVPAEQQDLLLATGTAAFHYMTANRDQARQEFQALFEHFPTAANTHYFYGYLLFSVNPDQAAEEFKRELQVTATNSTAQVMLAWYFLLQGDPVQALPLARRAVSEAPSSATGQLVLGRSLVETTDVPGGINHLTAALALDPSNLEVHLALAEAYSKSGHKTEAMHERLLCLDLTKGDAQSVANP